jgi:hypothetical protein
MGTSLMYKQGFQQTKIMGCSHIDHRKNFRSDAECKIIFELHNYKELKAPYNKIYIRKDVIIDDNVWLRGEKPCHYPE